MPKNLYAVLELDSKNPGDITQAEIRHAYGKLARRYHPDKNPNDLSAQEKFLEVTNAYQMLNNFFGNPTQPDVPESEEEKKAREADEKLRQEAEENLRNEEYQKLRGKLSIFCKMLVAAVFVFASLLILILWIPVVSIGLTGYLIKSSASKQFNQWRNKKATSTSFVKNHPEKAKQSGTLFFIVRAVGTFIGLSLFAAVSPIAALVVFAVISHWALKDKEFKKSLKKIFKLLVLALNTSIKRKIHGIKIRNFKKNKQEEKSSYHFFNKFMKKSDPKPAPEKKKSTSTRKFSRWNKLFCFTSGKSKDPVKAKSDIPASVRMSSNKSL